jgi:hypothetical protein
LERLTAFQALLHSLLWKFSLCRKVFCDIMALSYDGAVVRPSALCFEEAAQRTRTLKEKRF